MSNLPTYSELVLSVNQIKKQFVYGETVPYGNKLRAYERRISASRVLIVAEIERFVEESCVCIVNEHVVRHRDHNVTSSTIVHLIACFDKKIRITDNFNDADTVETITGLTHRVFLDRIKENHGVSEKYLTKLLVPLAFDRSVIDSVWIQTLNSYCSYRGAAAHGNSIQINDPVVERQLIDDIVQGFGPISREFRRLFRSKR